MKKHAFTAGLGAPVRLRPTDMSDVDTGTASSFVCVRRTHVDAQSTRRIHLAAGTQRCGSNSLI